MIEMSDDEVLDALNVQDLKVLTEDWARLVKKSELANGRLVVSLQRCKTMLQEEQQNRKKLEDKVVESENALKTTNEQFSNIKEQYLLSSSAEQQLKAKLSDMLNEIEKSRTEKDQRMCELQDNAANFLKDNEALKQKLKSLQALAYSQEEQIKLLSTSINEMKTENARLCAEKAESEVLLATQTTRNQALEALTQQLKKELSGLTTKIAELSTRPSVNDSSTQVEVVSDEDLVQFTAQNGKVINKSVQVANDSKTKDYGSMECGAQYSDDDKNEQLVSEINRLKTACEKASSDNRLLIQEKLELEESLQRLSESIANYLESDNDLKQCSNACVSTVPDIMIYTQSHVDCLKSECQQVHRNKVECLEKSIATLKDNKATLQCQLISLRTDNDSLNTQISTMKNASIDLERQLVEAKAVNPVKNCQTNQKLSGILLELGIDASSVAAVNDTMSNEEQCKEALSMLYESLQDAGKIGTQVIQDRNSLRQEMNRLEKKLLKTEKLYRITAGAFLNDNEDERQTENVLFRSPFAKF